MHIADPKNFWGGIVLAVAGAVFSITAFGLSVGGVKLLAGYRMGTPGNMGPGFFPFWLGLLLVGFGAAISISGMRRESQAETQLEHFHVKGLVFVLGSVVLFGLLLKPVGLLVAAVLLVIGSSMGSAEFDLRRALWVAVVLVAFCVLVFIVALNLSIPLCPDINALKSVRICQM